MDITGELVAEDTGVGATEEATGAGTADEPLPLLATAPQVPVNPVPLPVPALGVLVISGPGLGKTISVPSTDVQPFPRFAKKIPGRAEKATEEAARVPDPAEIVMDAQFM